MNNDIDESQLWNLQYSKLSRGKGKWVKKEDRNF